MFVVRRRAGEGVLIAGNIEVEVIEVSRSRVKLGIRAPRTVAVERTETRAVAEENLEAAKWGSAPEAGDAAALAEWLQKLSAEVAQAAA